MGNHIPLYSIANKVIHFDNSTYIDKDHFFTKHKDCIIQVIKSIQNIKHEMQAEDVVQDLYIAMYEYPIKFNNFKDEIHAIRFCCNWCKIRLKELMKKYRYEERLYSFTKELGQNSDSNSTEFLLKSFVIDENFNETSLNDTLINKIKERFYLLTERQLEILELQFIYGHSVNKISKNLGLAPGTISGTITDAINRIRKSFNLKEKDRERGRSKKKRIVNQYTLSGKFKATYYSVLEASNKTEIHPGSISNACLNKVDTAGGYLWEYIS